VRTRNESRLNHLYLSTIIWSGDETCLIDIPASCFDIMFRCLVSAEPGPITCQMTMFFHDLVPEMESVMLINYALQFEARLLRQVKGLVTIVLFLNSWLCALRSVSSNDFVRSIQASVSVL